MKKFINQFERLQSSDFFFYGYIVSVLSIIYGSILWGVFQEFNGAVEMLCWLAVGSLIYALLGEIDVDSIIRKYYKIFHLYEVTSSPEKMFLPKNEEAWKKYLAYCKTDEVQKNIVDLASLWARLMQTEMKAKGQKIPSTSVILSCCAAACQQTKLDDARYYAAAVLFNHWQYGEYIRKAMI